jgi:hypothetical protein
MMQELWDQFNRTFELNQGLNEAHEEACTDFHEHGLWDGLEAMAADINMNNVEQLWDEEDQDDLLSEILEQMGLSCCFTHPSIELMIKLPVLEFIHSRVGVFPQIQFC